MSHCVHNIIFTPWEILYIVYAQDRMDIPTIVCMCFCWGLARKFKGLQPCRRPQRIWIYFYLRDSGFVTHGSCRYGNFENSHLSSTFATLDLFGPTSPQNFISTVRLIFSHEKFIYVCMSRTDLHVLVESPCMRRMEPVCLEKVTIYGSSVKSIAEKLPYIRTPSQSISDGKSISLYFWVSELMIRLSELIALYFGRLSL